MDPATGIATPNTFNVDGDDVACICDGPHLLKNWKTALMTYDCFLLSDEIVKVYQLPSNKVKFSHILALAKFQADKKWVYAPALKDHCFVTGNFAKMKVQPAWSILSQFTAHGLEMLVEKHGFPAELLTTAWFCRRMG